MSTARATEPAFRRPLSEEELRAARRGVDLSGAATAAERHAIARSYGLPALASLAYVARLEPFGLNGWRLNGRISAAFHQECVVTLEPFEVSMDEPLLRVWSPDAPEDAATADVAGGRTDWLSEIPELAEQSGSEPSTIDGEEDEAIVERTPETLDPAMAALETFTLALDPYPRAPDAVFDGATHGPPGAAPLTDEATRPFAGLSALRDSMAQEADHQEQQRPGRDRSAKKGADSSDSGEAKAPKQKDAPENGENA